MQNRLLRTYLYRVVLHPCKLDVHPEFHSRPSVHCIHWEQHPNTHRCARCEAITALIEAEFTVYHKEIGWLLSPEVERV